MENAVQTLGRLRGMDGVDANKVEIDLRGANLQRANLRCLSFKGVSFLDAHLQGANLTKTSLQSSIFGHAQCQGAYFIGTKLQDASFVATDFSGANFIGTLFNGADFHGAIFGTNPTLYRVDFRGAAFRNVDFSTAPQINQYLASIFGDASATLPGGVTAGDDEWPPHWAHKRLDHNEFKTQWRAFQSTLPPGWDKS